MGGGGRRKTTSERERDAAAPVSRGLLPRLLGYHLRRAQSAVFKDFDERVGAREGITPGLFGMMQMIAANPGLSQSRLAEAMGVDRSTIVTAVDQLAARGLVERVASREDRRSHALRFTAQGSEAVHRMERLVLRHEAEFTSALSAEERETLVRLLTRLYERPGAEAGHPLHTKRTTRSER